MSVYPVFSLPPLGSVLRTPALWKDTILPEQRLYSSHMRESQRAQTRNLGSEEVDRMRKMLGALYLCGAMLVMCCSAFAGGGPGSQVTCVPAVPEPGSLAALAGGLGVLGAMIRFRRRG